MKTIETQNAVSTPATTNAEFVIDTKVTADGKVTVALNGQKMSLKKAIANLLDADAQIVKIRNEQGETLNFLFNDPFSLNRETLYFYWNFKTDFVDKMARGELDPKTGEPKSLTENTEVNSDTEIKKETEMTIQVGTISINASAVGNGRVVVKVYGNHECAPAKLDDIAAEMPRLSDINIIASDRRNFSSKGASYNGRYYAKANVYIFTNTSYGTADAKKMYKFDSAKEAVRKLARQELDDKIITAEELEILLAADREIERQHQAKLNAEREARDAEWAKYNQARHFAEKIAIESKSVDDNTDVFDLLPTADELNDVEIDDEAKTDEPATVTKIDFSDVADMFTPDVEIEPFQSRLVPDNNVTAEEPDYSDFDAELESEMKAEFAEVKAELQDMQTALEIEVSDDNADNAQVIAEKIVELNVRYGHLYEQIYGHTVEIFTNPAQVIADAIEITAIADEEQRKVFYETVAEINADKDHKNKEDTSMENTKPKTTAEMNAAIDRLVAEFDREQAEAQKTISLADLKAKYDASDDEDERVAIVINAYRKFLEPEKIKQERQISEQVCASLTADAPQGWAVTFTDKGNYEVTAHGLSAATLDTITAGDFLNPKEFFAKFNRTQADIDDEREATIAELKNQREQLLNMRAELVRDFPDEKERLKILDDMLAENDADITALESLIRKIGMFDAKHFDEDNLPF